MHGDQSTDGDQSGPPVFALSEQEQLRMRMHQVEVSVLRMHELMGAMAEKIGVDKKVIKAQGPKIIDAHPPVIV